MFKFPSTFPSAISLEAVTKVRIGANFCPISRYTNITKINNAKISIPIKRNVILKISLFISKSLTILTVYQTSSPADIVSK